MEFEEGWPNETIAVITAKVWYVSDFNASLPSSVTKHGHLINPQKRTETVLEENINYLNVALGNSRIPIRFRAWGSVQDIGLKDAQITGTTDEVFTR